MTGLAMSLLRTVLSAGSNLVTGTKPADAEPLSAKPARAPWCRWCLGPCEGHDDHAWHFWDMSDGGNS